jgi:WD40 repeat protein
VNYICWDGTGEMLASVSSNLVKVWNLTSGECVQELTSPGNQFYSSVFHPSYSTLLVVGGFSVSVFVLENCYFISHDKTTASFYHLRNMCYLLDCHHVTLVIDIHHFSLSTHLIGTFLSLLDILF